MKNSLASILYGFLLSSVIIAQTPPQQPSQRTESDEVVRITSELVQTDAVVTDKNDRIIPDLKINDFELYENGKRQEIKFLEFISTDTGRRIEGTRPSVPATAIESVTPGVSATELKRVIAFVVDDLTIPYEDIITTRQLLTDFIDNQMREGDLVAIVRVVGGNGLLQQFTSDRQLLRRAISQITPRISPYSAFNNQTVAESTGFSAERVIADAGAPGDGIANSLNLASATDETTRGLRSLISLSTADYVIDSLKQLPGRKSLVLISGGLPLYEISNRITSTGEATFTTNVSFLLNQLTDHASRAGVVINTLDVLGLKAMRGVADFRTTPARSASGSVDSSFGRLPDTSLLGNTRPFDQLSAQLGLHTLASATGGVSIVNTNNFRTGLDKILSRSAYYVLAYTPSEKFDAKFHKVQIKVKRNGAKVYAREGFIAKEDRTASAPKTKEQAIATAARSPLAKRALDVVADLQYKFLTDNSAAVDINMQIDAKKLNFTQGADGKYRTDFDVVGFVYDEVGKLRGGFSRTINSNLTPDEYKHALAAGMDLSESTQLPSGYFQLRVVVREEKTGHLGTLSRYLEVPDLTKHHLTMSSIFLYEVDPTSQDNKAEPLAAAHRISRKRDIRYAAAIYNAKVDKGSKQQVTGQLIISRDSKIIFKDSLQLSNSNGSDSRLFKVGQLVLSKVNPGRYVLTLIITDPLADKKEAIVSRSVDFTVIE